MTNEEQFEFLRHSIASHDHQLGEITDKLAKVSDGLDRLKSEMEHLKESQAQTDRQIAATTLNIDRLAAAMMGLTEHAIDHNRRIERLEKA